MVHSVLKNCLKILWLLAGFLSTLSLLLCFIPQATALTPGDVRIAQPRNGFYINRYTADSFPISGRADAGKEITIFANGVLMRTAAVDRNGFFSTRLDFSSHIEGPVTLLVFQERLRSIPITGTYDATPPRITAATIADRSIIITFNESNLQYADQERNYRFSPSLTFKTIGGTDDIASIDGFNFQLSMRSIPQDEIIHLSLSGITDAAGNVVAPMPIALNDVDSDRMADSWELQHSLNPLVSDASSDEDGDGFSNYQEYMARSNPIRVRSAPIEIRDTIPQDDAGIANFAWVPDQTAIAVLIRAVHGLDLNDSAAVRFVIDDGYHQPYRRDLSHDAVRVVKLNQDPDVQATYLWATYDRFLEPFIPTHYFPDAVIHVTVAIRDTRNNAMQPMPFEFKIESHSQKAAYRQNVPNTAEFYEYGQLASDGADTGIAVVDGKLAGAKLFYSSLEPLTPTFGNPDELPSSSRGGIQAAGVPVNLLPHTVFDRPVRLFIPVAADVDIRKVGLAYYNGTQWIPAVDAEGMVLPGGEGWMVPGSRINHEEYSPPLIEVQVHHFSATQAAVFANFGDTTEEDRRTHSSNAEVSINCFINSVSGGLSLGVVELIVLIGVLGLLLLLGSLTKVSRVRFQRTEFR